jgi:hypothetical protein
MVSPRVFSKYGCDTESLRKLFELPKEVSEKIRKTPPPTEIPTQTGGGPMPLPDDPATGEKAGVRRLRRLIYSRIQEGRTLNLRDFRYFAAIDYAYDAAYQQTTPTLVQHVIEKKMTYEESLEVIRGWGLNWEDIFSLRCDANGKQLRDTKGNCLYDVHAPSLVRTLIPLVKAYVTVRAAKLYTDRDQIPLFKYEPIVATEENRVLCEILTSVAEAMVTQFGYRAQLKDAILHDLLYGICMMFPAEAWYHEEQMVPDGDGFKKTTIREGLRFLQPHPTRFFYDLMWPTSSFNSDSGCEFSGHWRVVRYGSVYHNSDYFNKEVIPFGTNWFENTLSGTYFSDFYPCTMQFPSCRPVSESNREDRAAFYCLADEDKAIFLTECFFKLVPKEWDLGEYEYPVWFRFVVASNDTVIFAEPLSYTPNTYFGYDADGGRVRNPSMALELIPFQDQLGNILSQILLTAKQNLINVVFYDKWQVDATQLQKLKNPSEMLARAITWMEMDNEKNAIAGLDTRRAFDQVSFPKQSVAELTNTLNTVIGIAERMLVLSAQEIGSAASHQQSAQEIKTISGNVGVRVAYTGTFIDDAIDAWKKQIADASVAYMDTGFIALISPDIPNLEEHAKKLGFEVVTRGGGNVKTRVKVKKQSIMPMLLEGLASTRDGPDRGTDSQAATVQMKTWQAIASNPELAQQVGARTIVKGIEQAAILGGAGSDFKIEPTGTGVTGADEAQQAKQMQEATVQEAVKQASDLMAEQVVKPAAEQIAKQQAEITQLEHQVQQVAQVTAETKQAVMQLAQILQAATQAPPAPSPMTYDERTLPTPPSGEIPPDGIPANIPPQVALPAGAPPV